MTKSETVQSKAEVEALLRANEKLLAENRELEKELKRQEKSHAPNSVWRKLAIALCITAAAVILVVGNVFFWAGNTIINTDRYVETVQPLLQDKEIQLAIADYTTTQLFKQVDVNQVVQNALPEKAQF